MLTFLLITGSLIAVYVLVAFAIFAYMTHGRGGEQKNVLQRSLLPMVMMMALAWPLWVIGWVSDRMSDFFDRKD